MASKLADLLRQERGARFAAREKELALFHDLRTAQNNPFFLLFIHGPGGQGKTTLLEKYREICEQEQVANLNIDGRDLQPTPRAFLDELNRQIPAGIQDNFFDWLEQSGAAVVLFVDNYEVLQPIDNWLRREFLPRLTDNSRVVLCGRRPPAEGFVNDAGWKKLMRSINLRNFSREEAKAYLTQRSLPEQFHDRIFAVTHGHPLALSVIADTYNHDGGQEFNPEESSDVLRTLFERFVQEIGNAKFRMALETCALVHYTTESLLQFVLKEDDSTEYFDWLRQLSFIEDGRFGLFPSELAREAIIAELRWRNPDRFAELHTRAGKYYKSRLSEMSGEQQRRWLYELIYLHRTNPAVRPFFNWEDVTAYWMDQYQPEDESAVLAMTERHEGPESAAAARYWSKHPAAQTLVWRDENRKAVAFVLRIDLEKIPPHEKPDDPVMQRLLDFQVKQLPLRQDEHGAVFRFWMSAEHHQGISTLQAAMFLAIVQHYFTPGLAVSMFPCAFPEFWLAVLAYADMYPVKNLDFTAGEKPMGWFMHDWRQRTPIAWLDLLAKREIDTMADTPDTAEPAQTTVLVLSEKEFEEAVVDALKNWHQARDYAENPLLRSRVVVKHTGLDASPAVRFNYLRNRLQENLVLIENSMVDNRYHRVLYRTFFNPVGSQERTADYLNMSFSTYRRYLKAGIERISTLLWQDEIDK